MKNKKFFIDKGLGPKTRLDTFFILSYVYDYVESEGVDDKVVSLILSLRSYLDKNRYLIKDKDYSIIQLKTILERLNFLFEENLLLEEEKENILKKVNEGIIKEKDLNKKRLEIEEDFFIREYLLEISVSNSNKDEINKKGVYGIYIDDKLVYIGKTRKSFKERMQSHARNIESSDEYKYRVLRNVKKAGKQVSLRPLIAIEDLKVENKRNFSNAELNCMELALITYCKPSLNTKGVKQPYVFKD